MNNTISYFLIIIAVINVCHCYSFLIAFPVASKSVHHLMSSLGFALAKSGHSVTHLTSFAAFKNHPNITHLQPNDFSSELHCQDFFEKNSQLDLLNWIDKLFTTIPHKFWKEPAIWDLYHKRNQFDAIISTSYANEAFLPFLDSYNGTYIIVCTPGVEYNCLSYSGNWGTPSVIPNVMLSYDEYMTFTERVINFISYVTVIVYEVSYIVPNYMKTIRTYFPDATDTRTYYQKNHLTLINGHFALDSPIPLLPNQIEIGNINAKEAEPLPEDISTFINGSEEHGVIYFSLGSFVKGNEIPTQYKKILVGAFRRIPQRVIWKYEEHDLELPPNVMTKEWLPQQDILGHPKTRVFMSHCGNLGTQEAKYHGVPVLAVPVTFDQPRNAARLERKGYGIIVNWNQMTEDKIVEAINTLTKDNVYYDRMKAVSKVLKDQKESPAERAVWWIEYVIRHKGAPHLQYAGKRLHFLQYIMLDVLVFWGLVIFVVLFLFYWTSKKMWKLCIGSSKAKRE